MRALFRLLGNILLLAALAGFGLEVSNALEIERYEFIPLGQVWAEIHANSLVGLQTGVEAAWPWLWREIVLPILLWPVWAAPLGLGFLLRLIGRRPRARANRQQRERLARLMGALQNTDMSALRRQLLAKQASGAAAPAEAPTASPPKRSDASVTKTGPRTSSPVNRIAKHSADVSGLPRRSGPTVTRRS